MWWMRWRRVGWRANTAGTDADVCAQHARSWWGRDKNHPCVIIWAVGNENKNGKNNGVSAEIMKQMDPTRPRLVSCHDSNELEGNVELEDRHYPVRLAEGYEVGDADRRSERRYPLILMENPNNWEERNGADYGSLDLWGAVMLCGDWKVIWNEPHKLFRGRFVGMGGSRGDGSRGAVHICMIFIRKTGINIVKVKGLVDGFRNPPRGVIIT